jgi:tetratricopeptide (TPR) repeat protein
MTDDIITDLSKLSEILVISRNSSFTYKGKPVKVQQVAKDLSVQYVLEGSVRRSGNQVRINAQLIDAITGHHLWAERYDGKMSNIFDLQDKITHQIVTALAVKLTPNENQQLNKKETEIPEAYDYFLKGQEYFNRWTGEDLNTAIKFFKKAIELDSTYGKAYAALAESYLAAGDNGWFREIGLADSDGSYLQSMKYYKFCKKYPTIDSHRIASTYYLKVHQFEKAIEKIDKAIELNPNDPNNYFAKAECLIHGGRPQESIAYIEKGMKLDPLHLAPEYYIPLSTPLFIGFSELI